MRFIGFILRLIVLVAIVVWLTDQPGTARIVWHDYAIETSAALLALISIGFAFVLFTLFRIWKFIKDGPRFWRLRQKLRKLQKGQEQLAQGLVAIAAGDGPEAGRLSVSARKLLGTTPATRLLQAQAAQLAGDVRAAREAFLSLAADNDSAVLGYRGLIMTAMRSENWAEAEQYVEKLRRVKPETPWLNLILFELATRRQLWGDAQTALKTAMHANLLEPVRADRHLAALLMANALAAKQDGNLDKVVQLSEQALKLAPNWLPAVLLLAQHQSLTGHVRSAMRLIERNWARNPHPELATLYRGMGKEHNDPLIGYKQVEKLTKENASNTVSQFALAEAAFAADLWGAARRHLLAIASRKDATQGVFRLLAKLERRETGDERATARWLMRVSEALPDPRWLCQSCGGSNATWQPTCPHCGAFNALSWQIPGASRHEGKLSIAQQSGSTLISE
ncbi:MAG: heme biosynthesis HemY N-terminal domain-containing protein [Alphaproteobacteria bacterium]|nr:heme biosynthesis HemY N-terminal domain-containing protein [Alphaproteobacteria bacterium]